jgi:cytochrome P450
MPVALPFAAMPAPPAGRLGPLRDWLGRESAVRVLQRFERYADACGPVARIELGPVRMVVVSDPAITADVLASPGANHKGMAYVLTRVVLDNVLLLNGPAWAAARRLYRQALRDVDPSEVAARVVDRHLDALVDAGRRGPVRLDEAVGRMVGDVAAGFVAGLELGEDFEPHRRRIQHELAAVGIDLQVQPWTYLQPHRWIALRRSVATARGRFGAAVDERLARPDPSKRDVLAGFVRLAVEQGLDRRAIAEGVVNFYFAAHDVLASSTTWALHLLATHPEVTARLRASLATHGPEDDDGDVVLARTIKESLRLYPGYALFGRTSQADLVVGGYHVPRGTMLLFSPFVAHRRERFWPRPLAFDPDRWAEETPAMRQAWLPFGSGPRSCLASHLALPLLRAMVARVVRRVELEAVPGHAPRLAYWGTAFA